MKSLAATRWLAGVILAVCVGRSACAELPPSAYPNPDHATEAVDIEVLSSFKLYRIFASTLNVARFKVVATAAVKKVHRSETGLKPGDRVTLCYDTHHYVLPGWCGPGAMPVVTRGRTYRAHLMGSGAVYEPYGAPYSALGEMSASK